MSKTSDATLTLADLAGLARIMAEAEGPEQIFTAIADAANRFIGYKLITIMAFDAETMRVQRLYSSNLTAYPLGDGKNKRDTEWARHVLIEGRPYIGRTEEDIRANFEDHEDILGLELESVLNIPVRIYGRTIGTMNMLHETMFYDTPDLEWGLFLASQLISPLGIKNQYHPDHDSGITPP